MSKSRAQKAALNTITGAVSEVVIMVCGLILPRLIIGQYGSAYNGITASAKQFLSAISFFNLGIAGTTRVALYRSLADGDLKKTSGIVKATELHMCKVGLVLAVYVLGLAALYPLFVDTGYGWLDVALLILAAGITNFGSYFFGTTYQAFLSADQSVYISNIFLTVAVILNTVVSVILIRMKFSIQVVKLASAGVMFLKPLLQNIYVSRKYKLDKKAQPDRSALAMRKDVMAHSVANIIHDHTDMVVLTIFAGVKVVSVYSVYNLIMNALKKMQSVFTSGTEAIFGSMWAKQELDKMRKVLKYYEYVVAIFVSVVFSASLVMILPFISLYTKKVTDEEYILPMYAFVIILAQMFYCFRAPYLTMVQGVGRYKETKKGAYAEAGINLGLSVLLVQFYGIVGVAIGTLVANIFRTCQYALYIEKKIMPRGIMNAVWRIVWALANVAIVYFSSSWLLGSLAYQSWGKWVLGGFITVFIAVAVTLITSFIFYKNDLGEIWKIGKTMIKKKLGRKKK